MPLVLGVDGERDWQHKLCEYTNNSLRNFYRNPAPNRYIEAVNASITKIMK